jgi:hypothetical protein
MSEQFHIPSDWPVLVVEDTEDRISWFKQRMPKAVFAKNAEAAFRALDQQEFKVIFLDHDLHWMHADNSIFKGTGKEVARFLAKKDFRGIVIIHSKHVEGAAINSKMVSGAGIRRTVSNSAGSGGSNSVSPNVGVSFGRPSSSQ